MLNITIERELNEQDGKIIKAFKHDIKLYPKTTIENYMEVINDCNFENHIVGRGGSHIFITRKIDNERIAIIR